ncbi:hypothetical protein ACFPIJ_41935 [Dactylosporangium cerinum]|uniref:Uncharacterized protein n=1 Tax=Dactylosporangium cerinum TaxID=1434730 RepID=A0ABV9W6R4_9ACTN
MRCDVCGGELRAGDETPWGTWWSCGTCFATALTRPGEPPDLPPFRPLGDRWTTLVEEQAASVVWHALVFSTLTGCGRSGAGMAAENFSWKPDDNRACERCRRVLRTADAHWPRGVRGRPG